MKTLKAVEPQKIVPIHFNFRESEIGAILVNPLRGKIQTRIVTWSLVIVFSFLQIVPTGWAATRPVPVDERQARSVPASIAAFPVPAATQPIPAPKKPVAFLDSTVFLTARNPLSKATVDAPKPAEQPSKEFAVKVETTVPIPGSKPAEQPSKEVVVKVDPIVPTPGPKPIPVPPLTKHYEVKVITDPATGRELSVTIDEHGIATVKWGDQEYKGFFDPRTNSVILVTKDDAVWTLRFGKNEEGELYLQTFQTRNWNGGGYSEETYTYDQQGQLTRKDWQTEYSYSLNCFAAPCPGEGYHSGTSGGTIDYVTINGKTLVSHEKTWSEENGIWYERVNGRSETENWYSYDHQGNLLAKHWTTNDGYGGNSFGQEQYIQINGKTLLSVSRIWQSGMGWRLMDGVDNKAVEGQAAILPRSYGDNYHAETYYHYDAQGNLLAEVNAWERYDFQGVRQTGGSYWLRDEANNTWSFVSAEGINNWAIRSWEDWKLIDQAAQRKTVYAGGSGERYDWKYRVEYTRDSNGAMTAKATYDLQGNVSIVQGEPDILSGETNDIKFVNGQTVNGQRVYYQEYWHQDTNGNWVNEGYRLIFYDQKTWNVTAVDFPAQNTVELNGELFKITVEQDGKLVLDKINVLSPTEQYVNELQKLLGHGFLVTLRIYQMGMPCREGESCPNKASYRIFIQRNSESDIISTGNLQSMSFNISEDGKPDWSSLQATYSEQVDAQLLFEGMIKLQNYCPPGVSCTLQYRSDFLQAIVDMTRILVTDVENGAIHFTLDSKNYKAYRDEQGNVKLEEEKLPPAVQAITAIVSTGLMNAFGFSKEVFDQLVKDGKIVIKVDFESLTATVTIDPLVQPVAGAGNGDLTNLLALGQFPGEITFTLGSYVFPLMIVCPVDGPCPQAEPTYFLKEGSFSIGGLSYRLSYFPEAVTNGRAVRVRLVGDNWLHSVEVWQGPVCAKDQICPTYATRLIETLTFSYLSEDGAYTVEIRYLNVAADGIATRLISIQRMQDGALHIQSIEDRDAKGNVVANNKFAYRVLIPSCAQPVEGPANCGPAVIILSHIARTTTEGKPLSSIKIKGDIAVIMLARGLAMEVKFTSLEQLLDVARQFENGVNFDFPLLSTNSFEPLPLQGSYWEDEKAVKTDSNSLTALKFTPVSYQKKVGTSRKVFSSLRSVSAALSEPLFITGDQGSGVTPLFSFEKGHLLKGKILTELAK